MFLSPTHPYYTKSTFAHNYIVEYHNINCPNQLPFQSTTTIICFPPEPEFRLYCIHTSNSTTNITQPKITTAPTAQTNFTVHYEPPGLFFTKCINVKPQPKKTSFHQRLHIKQIPNKESAEFFKAVSTQHHKNSQKTFITPSIPKPLLLHFQRSLKLIPT